MLVLELLPRDAAVATLHALPGQAEILELGASLDWHFSHRLDQRPIRPLVRRLGIAALNYPLRCEFRGLGDHDNRGADRRTSVFGAEVEDDQVADRIRGFPPVADPPASPPGGVVVTLIVGLDPVAAAMRGQVVLGKDALETRR